MSPDEDFSPTGSNSGIKYSEVFKKYKEMLTANPDSPVYKRIFLTFNTSLFGARHALSADAIAEDGDYDSELGKFNAGLHADPLAEDADMAPVSLLPESPGVEAPELPPLHSEHHVSVSVTSHVSTHATAASSQVSNIVSSSVTLPSVESEVQGAPPLIPKAVRPAPRKKGSKLLKKATVTSVPGVVDDAIPAPAKKPVKNKSDPVDPPAKTLRNRR